MTDSTENENKEIEPEKEKKPKPKSIWHWKSVLKSLLLLYLIYLAAAAGLLYYFADNLALFPSKDMQDKEKILSFMEEKLYAKADQVKFKAVDGSQLSGWYFKNGKPQKNLCVLVSHGNAGNVLCRCGIAAYMLNAGVSVFLYDYRGYGESEGEAHLANLVPDAESAYDFVNQKLGYKPSQIILYGESIGCGVASDLAKKKESAAVILQSPFTSLIQAAKDHIFFLNTLPDIAYPPSIPHLDNLSYVKQPHPPLLIIHGEKDWTLPCAYSRTLFKDACEPKTLFTIPMAGHNDVYEYSDSGLLAALTKFIDSLK